MCSGWRCRRYYESLVLQFVLYVGLLPRRSAGALSDVDFFARRINLLAPNSFRTPGSNRHQAVRPVGMPRWCQLICSVEGGEFSSYLYSIFQDGDHDERHVAGWGEPQQTLAFAVSRTNSSVVRASRPGVAPPCPTASRSGRGQTAPGGRYRPCAGRSGRKSGRPPGASGWSRSPPRY